jgi:hypothetical protein
MNDSTTDLPPLSNRSGVTDSVRVQILATEHWGLLATRSMIWNQIFSRASMFLTLLSAVVVALALVAQATGFGSQFRLFALLVLPVLLLLGFATFVHLGEANGDDMMQLVGMNRLRRAYLELAPELEPYFSTGSHDDLAGIRQTYGPNSSPSLLRILGGTPMIIATINVVVAGVIAALVADALGATDTANLAIGLIASLVTAFWHGVFVYRGITILYHEHHPRFPS